MNMREKLAELMESAEAFKGRTDLTSEEATQALDLAEQITELKGQIAEADKAQGKIAGLFKTAETPRTPFGDVEGATMGERLIKSAEMRAVREAFPHGIGEKQTGRLGEFSVTVGRKEDPEPVPSPVISRPVAGYENVRFEPGIVNPLEFQRRLTLLDLITKGTTDATAMKYRFLKSVTNNAAIVPESLDSTSDEYLKPISTLEFDSALAAETTYADGLEVTVQEWNDDGALRALVDSTLARNIELVVQDMVLNGTGTGDEPLGILNAEIGEQAFDTDIFTTIRKARGQLDALGYTPTALVVSAADAETIALLKADNGTFYGGGPLAAGNTPSLWGVPLVVSPQLDEGTAVMGDWTTVHLLTRDPLNINLFDQHKDYAQRNLLYLRAEFRGLQLLRAPASFVKVSLAGN